MNADNGSRLLIIKIIDILNKYSSEKNRLYQNDIISYLKNEYDINISRQSLSAYLKELKDSEIIAGNRGIYLKRLFNDTELRLLIDSVMFNKTIIKNDAVQIIEKLKKLSYKNFYNKYKSLYYSEGINRIINNNIPMVLDLIDEAIDKEYKIRIQQFNIFTGDIVNSDIVDPYYIVSDQSRYYLLCGFSRNDKPSLEPRRIDKIKDVQIIKEKRRALIDVVGHNFSLDKYLREHIYMFSGDVGEVIFRIDKKGIDAFIDWCGYNNKIKKEDENYYLATTITNYKAAYYWAMQYGGIVEVISPLFLRRQIVEGLKKMLDKYK